MNYFTVTLALLLLAVIPANSVIRDRKRTRPYRCPPLSLTNGYTRIKNGGQELRFKCQPGFRLLGDQYGTCVRGRWNVDMPVCVRRGCDVLPDPTSGWWQLSMGGAVATLVCDPGYALDSAEAAQVYCNGRLWRPRTQDPSCRAVITSPKTSCDFESEDICGWSQDSVNDFLWIRNNYSTPSGHLNTGPSYDHTYGIGYGGHYMYIESSSPRKENDFARLYSPVYGKDVADDGCFMFWYNMFGTTIGSLKIYVKPQTQPFKDLVPAFQKFGNQGARWLQGIVSLTSVNETFQVIIEATRGNGFLGDIAVDDVAIRNGDDCLVMPDQPITAAIRQDGETATREPPVKSFPTFLPAPPLPDLPPMPPAAEASQTPSATHTPPPPPPNHSTFSLPSTPQTAVIATSTSSLKSTNSTATSAPPLPDNPRQTTTSYATNRTETATVAFSVSERRTVATDRPSTVAATEGNKSTVLSSTAGVKNGPVVPVTVSSKLNSSATTSASFNITTRPTTKLTSARFSSSTKLTVTTTKSPPAVPTTKSPPAVPTTKSPPTVPTTKSPPTVLITRTTLASTTLTTRRPTTSTTVKVTVPKLPVTKLVTKPTVASTLPSKATTPSTTTSIRYKVQKAPTTVRTTTTPTTLRNRFLPTTVSTTTLLPLATTGSTKPASPTFQRVLKPRWSPKRRQDAEAKPYMTNETREGNPNEYNDNDNERTSQICATDSQTDVVDECVESQEMQRGIGSARHEVQSQALPEISPPAQDKTSIKKIMKDTIASLLKRSMEQHEERSKVRLEERRNLLAQTSADPLYHFFMSMYQITKNMPPSSQFVVRNDIFRVVTEMESSLLNIPDRTPQSITDQRLSYRDLSPYSNQIPSPSHTTSSTPALSSHSKSPSQTPQEN